MEISFVNKNKSIQPQQPQDQSTDAAKNISREENCKYVNKNKVDSAEISSSHTGIFDDKKLYVAKSAILYDVSVGTQSDHIAEIKHKIEKGIYDVPSNLLAEAMLS